MYESVENVGVEGERRVRWIMPWPGTEDEGLKGEGMLWA